MLRAEQEHQGPLVLSGLLPTAKKRFRVNMKNLYHPSNLANPQDAIYLHEWLS